MCLLLAPRAPPPSSRYRRQSRGDGIVEHASGIVANLMQGYAACYTVSTPAACPECRMAGPRLQSQLFRRCGGRTVMCA